MSDFKEKETIAKYVSSKFEHDLYHDEDHKKFPLVRIKNFFDKKTKKSKWKFFENSKNTLTLEEEILSENQIKFLQTVEGINFCLKNYKNGIKTQEQLLLKLKEKLNEL